jgi:hypothetical protein
MIDGPREARHTENDTCVDDMERVETETAKICLEYRSSVRINRIKKNQNTSWSGVTDAILVELSLSLSLLRRVTSPTRISPHLSLFLIK